MILLIAGSIGYYFTSDYSKVKSLQVIGNEEVKTEDILKAITVNQSHIHLFVRTSSIEKEVKSIPMIKKVNVTKDLFGHIKIEVEEAEKVAYCVIDGTTYVIDELGGVSKTEDPRVIHELQSCPQLSGFKDEKFLKTFAKEYVQISELIKNQTSDIMYEPKPGDETRLKFLMVNGKILYLRVEDMVKQLSNFDYEANMTAHPDIKVFSFEGGYLYMK